MVGKTTNYAPPKQAPQQQKAAQTSAKPPQRASKGKASGKAGTTGQRSGGTAKAKNERPGGWLGPKPPRPGTNAAAPRPRQGDGSADVARAGGAPVSPAAGTPTTRPQAPAQPPPAAASASAPPSADARRLGAAADAAVMSGALERLPSAPAGLEGKSGVDISGGATTLKREAFEHDGKLYVKVKGNAPGSAEAWYGTGSTASSAAATTGGAAAKPSEGPALADPAKVAALKADIEQLQAKNDERKSNGTLGSAAVRVLTGGALQGAEEARDGLVWQAATGFDKFTKNGPMTQEQYEHLTKNVDRAYKAMGEVRALRDEGVGIVRDVGAVTVGLAAAPFTGGSSLLATAAISGGVSAATKVGLGAALDGNDYSLKQGAIDAGVGFAEGAVPVAAIGGAARLLPRLPSAVSSAVDRFLKPIHDPANVASAAVGKSTASDLKALDKLGVKTTESAEMTYLEGSANHWGSTKVTPDASGSVNYGKILVVDELPAAGRGTGPWTNAFSHPEMAAYKAKLEDMGFRLVVDTSLPHTGAGAYLQPGAQKMLALRPDSTWQTFLHEFQHAEFHRYIERDFSLYQQAVSRGHSIRDVLPRMALDELPAHRVDRLEELMRKGLTSNSANETLSVGEELRAMGFRRHIPWLGSGAEKYALRHQITDFTELARSGTALSTEQQAALNSARWRYAQLLGQDIAKSAAAGAAVGAAIEGLDRGRRPEDYVQVLYNERGTVLGQLPDGTWERLSRDGR